MAVLAINASTLRQQRQVGNMNLPLHCSDPSAQRHRDPGQPARSQRLAARRAIEAAGASLRFLPAYSSNFNPIENAFAKLKAVHTERSASRNLTGSSIGGRAIHGVLPASIHFVGEQLACPCHLPANEVGHLITH